MYPATAAAVANTVPRTRADGTASSLDRRRACEHSASTIPIQRRARSGRPSASDLGEAPARIALRCYITKNVMSPVIPGLFYRHAVSWCRSGREGLACRTDFPGAAMRVARLSSFAPGRLCDRRARPRRMNPPAPEPNRSAAPVPESRFRRRRLVLGDRLPRQHQGL